MEKHKTRYWITALVIGLLGCCASMGYAEPGLPAVVLNENPDGGKSYTLTLQVLALMTVISLLPALMLTMTSFTRIIIVLSILRQAMGTAQTPSNQILLGLALFLTMFIMAPVFNEAYSTAYKPYSEEEIDADTAIELVKKPFHKFMLQQTRESDIELFASMAKSEAFDTPADVPLNILMPAFLISELKTAFQIGFLIFIPFLIIDLVVASTLMAMGMMMLSPLIISVPFKLMLFVLIDGWALLSGTLINSFVPYT